MLVGGINLSKIDKTKLFTTKNGDKYLNVVVWINDEVDQYGNSASVQQSLSKEDREAGVKATYIGNLKDPQQPTDAPATDDDDLAF